VAIDTEKAGILDRLSPDGQKALLGQEILRLGLEQESLQGALVELGAAVGGLTAAVGNLEAAAMARGQRFFARTATLKAAEAGTRVHLLPASELGEDQKAYPLGFFLVLAGEEPWSGGTGSRVFLADSGVDLVYRFASIATSALMPGSFISPSAGGVTLDAEFGLAVGGRPGKGIDIVADGNFEAGSDLAVTVYGYIA
jgi:hypothetical protein